VLLERDRFASGTTWHAAGIVGQLRDSKAQTELAQYTTRLFQSLEAETGQATGYRENGSMTVALTPQRLEVIRRNVSAARRMGVAALFLTPGDIRERWPLLRVDDVLGGQFVPANGQVNPLDVTAALIKGARQRGAVALENTPVEDILIQGGRVTGVRTRAGDIACERVLLAGGLWTHLLAKRINVPVPLHAAEHFYIVTEPVPGLARSTPILTVADERAYYKEDAGKLLIGGFEAAGKAWPAPGQPIPTGFSFQELPPDLEHMEPILAQAFGRVPVLNDIGVQLFFCGPESFTPDGRARPVYRRGIQFQWHSLVGRRGQGHVEVADRRLAAGRHGGAACPARVAVPGEYALLARPGGRIGRHAHDAALAGAPGVNGAPGAAPARARSPARRRRGHGGAHRMGDPAVLRPAGRRDSR